MIKDFFWGLFASTPLLVVLYGIMEGLNNGIY